MSRRIFPQVIDNTGEVVGLQPAQPAEVKLHGWAFSNSAGAVGNVKFYAPAPVANQVPALPSAAGTLLFTIDIPVTNVSKEFFCEEGIFFKDGVFAIASASTVTGCVFYS